MNDPVMAVPPFAAQFEGAVPFVESRTPGDQFGDAARRLANHGINHLPMAEFTAGGERIGHVVVEPILGINDAGDAPLRPLARRALEVVFCDHGQGESRIDRKRCPQAGQATAEDEYVGEAVRHPLRAERHQIPRAFEGVAHSAAAPWRNALNCSR